MEKYYNISQQSGITNQNYLSIANYNNQMNRLERNEEEEEAEDNSNEILPIPKPKNTRNATKSKKQQVVVADDENEPDAKNAFANYLMQPPDSESIAAAAANASANRCKRRTRIKFDKRQIDLLEAAFQRAHYPDVHQIMCNYFL
jgi:hypothetical protein